ncbi:hypothetical protein G4B88_006031, partial [Cannabis sativa]
HTQAGKRGRTKSRFRPFRLENSTERRGFLRIKLAISFDEKDLRVQFFKHIADLSGKTNLTPWFHCYKWRETCWEQFSNSVPVYHVDDAFQKGLVKHTSGTQQQFESTHSPLAAALRDVINSASMITRTLSGELAEGLCKLMAFAAAGASSKGPNSLTTQLSNGPLSSVHEMAESPVDPIKELSRLIAERKFEEAFTGALHRSDVSIVSWLCSQVDLPGIMSLVPLPLSQGVVLALLQQLACDINNDMSRKLAWMTDVAVAINPTDPLIALHVRPIFEKVYQTLEYHRNQSTTSASDINNIRLLMHLINSVLMSCK